MFDSADITTSRTLTNIKKVLIYSLREKYGIEDEEVLHSLLDIHGITPHRFDFVKTIETAIAEKLNDFSIDSNSNKNEKTIEAVTQEAMAPVKKAIGYDLLYRQMLDMYGKEEAKRLTGELYDLSLGLSDSTNILKPYCWAFNASFIVTEGRKFGQLYSKPASRVSSYISALCETVHQLSSHLAGAIAIGSFFLDIAHLSLYGKDHIDLRELKTNKLYRKKLENEFQQFVHCVTEDTEVLTPQGFKDYKSLNVGDYIYTWNEGVLNVQNVDEVNVYKYEGDIHRYVGQGIEQEVTPEHRVVYIDRKVYIKKSEELINMKGRLNIPISADNPNNIDIGYSDDLIQLLAIVLTDGHLLYNKGNFQNITINKSFNRSSVMKILIILLNKLKLGYSTSTYYEDSFTGCDNKIYRPIKMKRFIISKEDSSKIFSLLKERIDEIPKFLLNMSKRQCLLFTDTWSKFGGYYDYEYNSGRGRNIRMQCANENIANRLQHILFLAGYGSSISYIDIGNKEKTLYVIPWYSKTKSVSEKEIVKYKGIVWCPTTKDGVVIFRKNGKIFVSGNSVNHLSRSGSESPFTNLSIFDSVKLRFLIKDMSWYFPFDEIPIYHPKELTEESRDTFYTDYLVDYIMEIQDIFLNFFDLGDPSKNGAPYRFPIVTLNFSKKTRSDKEIIEDQKFLRSVCKRDIFRYNIFVSKGTKVASCCFDKNQKILFRSSNGGVVLNTFENIFKLSRKQADNPKIFHNGTWRGFSRVKVPYDKKYYKIVTVNNKEIIVTKDHLNPTLRGDIESKDLSVEDYLLFNSLVLDGVSECDRGLTYSQGYLIGCFLGDGSFGKEKNGKIYQTVLSLNPDKYKRSIKKINKALKLIGSPNKACLAGDMTSTSCSMLLNSPKVASFIKLWVKGTYCFDKSLDMNVLLQSVSFRKGILSGWEATDGGNNNRVYSTSSELIETMEALCTSIGLVTSIDESDRTNEKAIIRGEEWDRNYPLLCLRYYTPKNRRSMGDVYIVKNNSIYFKIKSIKKVLGSDIAYCVKMDEQEPYFTLPNGIITHNCRLISDSEMLDYAAQANSFGGGGSISLGSHRVCTINFMRIALEAKTPEDFFDLVRERVESSAKVLKAHKDLLQKLTDQGLQMFISMGWINMKRLFSTFGMLGLVEASEIFYERFGDEIKEGTDIIKNTLESFNEAVSEYSKKYDIIGNIEQIPAESFAIRLAVADKLIFGDKNVPYKMYSNQFIPLWEDATIWEKMDADGKYNKLITGGGIVHVQIGERVTTKQAEKIIRYSVNSGCEHFALNSVWSECTEGHMVFGRQDKCTECGADIKEYYTRVVGFFTPVSSWQEVRREWEFPNRTFSSLPKSN